MPYAVFNKDTKRMRAWHRHAPPPEYDPAQEVLVEVPGDVDHRTERWDGASGVRPATAQEIADYDAEQLDAEALAQVDGQKAIKALVIWTAGRLGISASAARTEILSIYKGL